MCSTFIPYFATKNDLRNTTNKSDSAALSSMKSKTTNLHLVNNIDNKAQKMFKQAQMLEGSNEIKRYLNKICSEMSLNLNAITLTIFLRSRRKARLEQKRIRIRPCLSVCQTVEQKCPYMLPADRAPAYPTQYAGEPTFLCLGQ